MSIGDSILLPDGRYPFDGDPANVVWPVTLAELKKHIQVGHSLEDSLLEEYLADAVEYIEARGQVSLIHQRRRISLDCLPYERLIDVVRGPLVSIDQIQYLDSDEVVQTLDADYYWPDIRSKWGSIYFKASDFVLADRNGGAIVWVDVTTGFGIDPKDVPAQWRQLVRTVATHSYERRELASGGGLDEAWERVINRKVIAAGGSRRYV